ncbi:Unknown protein, partial [Striga hermonthica]
NSSYANEKGEKMWKQTSEVTLDEFCGCGKRTIMVTSWTDNNPGRRYATCKGSKNGRVS